ncbi:MAG: hypothetical protein ACTSQD_02865 [Promethearchaeota archaeon]
MLFTFISKPTRVIKHNMFSDKKISHNIRSTCKVANKVRNLGGAKRNQMSAVMCPDQRESAACPRVS